MRFLRAFAGAAGASGSLIAAAGLLLAFLSAGLAFHGWPALPHADRAGGAATDLAGDPARPGVAHLRSAASVTTLPAVPVATAATAERRTGGSSRRHRNATVHRRSSFNGRPTTAPVAGQVPVPANPPVSGGVSGGASGGARTTSGDVPSAPSGVPTSGATSGAQPATPVGTPAPASPPVTPAVPPVPAAPDGGQAVKDATQAAGTVVSDATDNVAQAVKPASPTVADTVSGAGQTVDSTVTQVGQVVGGLLGGKKH
ncbi:MAG: hypothetical protein QOK49_1411 [Baekduia sp.]|nr:hypothetical protein [Baekduia sp.]